MQQYRADLESRQEFFQESVMRQGFVVEKLERDGGYACEIQMARRLLRTFEERLRAAQGQRN